MTDNPSTPRQVRSQSIATALEAEILLGDLASGSRLDEVALARRFGVSRTPVREALQMVVSRALAVRLPYKGVIVADISPERIDQFGRRDRVGDRRFDHAPAGRRVRLHHRVDCPLPKRACSRLPSC